LPVEVRDAKLSSVVPTGVPPEPLENTLRVAYEGNYLGTTWAVVHWFLATATGEPTDTDMTDVAEDLWNAFHGTLMDAYCVNDVHLTTVVVNYYLPDQQRLRARRVGDSTGDAGGSPLPAQVSTMINWSSRDGRRGGKPRSFMPGASSDNVTESYAIAAGVLGALTTAANAYKSQVNAIAEGNITSLTFMENSTVDALAYRPVTVQFAILSGSPRVVVATQRRRVDRQAH
jgi:hypothetical protein